MVLELRHHVGAFRRGQESASGNWLVRLQSSVEAWSLCVSVLQSPCQGRQSGEDSRGGADDDEFVEVFCSQTLAHHARVLAARHPRHTHQARRDELEMLLARHLPPKGRTAVWKQLALALTSAEIWLGHWRPGCVLETPNLPRAVVWELLVLPTELLFCDKALPLSDLDLWHAAAAALFDSCAAVFDYMLASLAPPAMNAAEHRPLRAIASWLRAARMCFEWLSGRPRQEEAPVAALAARSQAVLAAAACSALEDISDVAQQLARWRHCDAYVSPLLGALLDGLFQAQHARPRLDVLLPLLEDLAFDRWARACLGQCDLDWQAIGNHALVPLRLSMSNAAVEGSVDDGETALAVWHGLATTLRFGTREWPDEADYGGPHAEWFVSNEVCAQAPFLPLLFGMLAKELLDLLRLPASPSLAHVEALWQVRRTAQSAIAAWAQLVGNGKAWQEALWSPLQHVGKRLKAASRAEDGSCADKVLLSEAEVVLWFSATLAASWPESAGSPPAAIVVHELAAALDAAPQPWRALLWSAACSLASTAPAEHCPGLIEVMLQRPPRELAAGSAGLLALTELAYASAIDMACRQLPLEGSGNMAAAERIAALALAETPAAFLHEDASLSRAKLLSAMRRTMASDVSSLCQGLSATVLPTLRSAAASEAEAAAATAGGSPGGAPLWHGAETLFAALAAVLPPTTIVTNGGSNKMASSLEVAIVNAAHPVAILIRENWPCLEAALLPLWRPLNSSEEPLATASKVLARVATCVPVLLPDVLHLLVQSVAQHALPELQLQALCQVVRCAPCPPMDAVAAAELLVGAVASAADAVLSRPLDACQSPQTARSLFRLAASAIDPSVCRGQLRPLLLRQSTLINRLAKLMSEMLPDCPCADTTDEMLRFSIRLVQGQEPLQTPYRDCLLGLLPCICASLCRAMASQEHLNTAAAVVDAAEILFRGAEAFPDELPPALKAALMHVEVPDFCREQLMHHVEQRSRWPKRSEWTIQLQQIVSEWQKEWRLNSRRKLSG